MNTIRARHLFLIGAFSLFFVFLTGQVHGALKAGGLVSYPAPMISGNQLKNPGFDTIDATTRKPADWRSSSAFSGDTATRRSGPGSIRLQDAPLYPYSESAMQTVYLKKGSYRIRGWTKLDNLGASGKGVRLSLTGAGSTPVIYGTSEWQQLSAEKIAVKQDGNYTFKIEAYSEPAGTAWFDDVELRRENLPVEVFLLYPNYRGMLFDDQSQVIRLNVKVDPPEGSVAHDYVVQNTLVDEANGAIMGTTTRLAEEQYVESLDGSNLLNGRTYLLKTKLVKTADNSLVYEYPAYRISKVEGAQRTDMTVSFDENNRFVVRGKPIFWIGVYDSGMGYPPTEAQWETQLSSSRRLFELPINLYNNYWYGTISQASAEALMNVLQRKGIFYLQTGNAFANTYTPTDFKINTDDIFLSAISAHPGLAGFYTVDEAAPGLAPTMFDQYQRLRSFKPDGVTFGALLHPNTVSYWRDTIDMLAMDPYPLYGAEPATGYPLNLVSQYTAATREGVMNSRPIVTVLQFFKGTSNSRWPTREELRNMTYMAIAEGANGVIYWSLGARALDSVCSGWCAEKVGHFEDLKAVMNELKGLEPALTSIDRPELLRGNSNPAEIHTRVKAVNGKSYLFASNNSASSVSATFTWTDTSGSVTAYGEGRSLPISGAGFSDVFTPYQAHVYEISGSPVTSDTMPPTITITSPLAGSVVKGTTTIEVTAKDNIGVARVELVINGKVTAVKTSPPHSFSWDSGSYPVGSNNIIAANVYDAAGNQTTSNSIQVTVQDSMAPLVDFSSPPNNSRVSSRTRIAAAATDNDRIVQMMLYIDGNHRATVYSSSLSWTWNTRKATPGAHTIMIKAFDAEGNVGSNSLTVYK